MTRSQKIRRFYKGKNRAEKITAMQYMKASLGMLVDSAKVLSQEEIRVTAINRLAKSIETLQRQLFVIDHPQIDFEVRQTGDEWSPRLYVPIHHSTTNHRLYRVILSEEDEMLFMLST